MEQGCVVEAGRGLGGFDNDQRLFYSRSLNSNVAQVFSRWNFFSRSILSTRSCCKTRGGSVIARGMVFSVCTIFGAELVSATMCREDSRTKDVF